MPAQTLSQIREKLAQAGLRPQHRLGQNFLIDLNLMRKVAAAAELRPEDVVLEVGPGTGSLTSLALEAGCRVICVEIDRGLQALLGREFADQPGFRLVCGDALSGKHTINPDVLAALTAAPPASGAYKLLANLPYQIATPLLVDLLLLPYPARRGDREAPPAATEPLRFERLICTIQKEVADRLAAGPDDDAYGPLSVVVQTLARVDVLATLPPQAFWPAPKVASAAVRITPLAADEVQVTRPAEFAQWVQRWFAMRRKKMSTIARKLDVSPEDQARAFAGAGVNPDARPEALPPDQWRALARQLGQ